ncbi:MAG: hypothetical protein QUU85_17040, partial [Candidatus Eisenbacteria bacterium]|nr:hypothetical protein [Candidatus Eisenbacteria bacterium]
MFHHVRSLARHRFLPAPAQVLLAALAFSLIVTGCGHDGSDGPSSPAPPQDQRQYGQPPASLPDEYPDIAVGGDPGDPPDSLVDVPMLVRYRAFDDPQGPDRGMWIREDGYARAMEPSGRHMTWIVLSEERMTELLGWFDDARFAELAGPYLTDHPRRVRLYDVLFDPDDGAPPLRMTGEEALMPEELRTLVARLDELAVYILENGETNGPPPHPPVLVRGVLSVEPVEGVAGTPRAIQLELSNSGTEAVTLHFPTEQLYDLFLVSPDDWMPGGPGGHGGPEDPGCGNAGGMGGNGMDGMGGGRGGHGPGGGQGPGGGHGSGGPGGGHGGDPVSYTHLT